MTEYIYTLRVLSVNKSFWLQGPSSLQHGFEFPLITEPLDVISTSNKLASNEYSWNLKIDRWSELCLNYFLLDRSLNHLCQSIET